MKKVLIFCFVIYSLITCDSLFAQSPFGDQPVAVSKSSAPENDQQNQASTGFWSRLRTATGKTIRKVVAAGKSIVNKAKTPDFVEIARKIPGHETKHFVCQGICYLPDKIISPVFDQHKTHKSTVTLLSYYPKKEETDMPAQIVAIDTKTGRALRRFPLYEKTDKPYTGHAGGITVAGRYLWVASGFKLYGFPVQAVIDYVNDSKALADNIERKMPPSFRIPEKKLVAETIFNVDAMASYVSFCGKYLWTGDFVKSSNSKYTPVEHHSQNPFGFKSWIAGYEVDKNGRPTASVTYRFSHGGSERTAHKPDRVIYCRESAQGVAFCNDHAALSISYGATNSKLALYRNPKKQTTTEISYKPAGQTRSQTVKAWVLAEKTNWVKTLELPAGSEDLEFDGNNLLVSFEGASENYRHRWSLNPLVKIEEKFYSMPIKKLISH